MAKIVRVTYGTHGDTPEYDYVVNDNVRTGDIINPSVKHYKSGKIFGTTGIVQKAVGENTKAGLAEKQRLASTIKFVKDQSGNTIAVNVGVDIEKAYTGKELGVQRQRTEKGTFQSTGSIGKTVKNLETGKFQAQEGKEFVATPYIEETRKRNVELRKQEEQQTYDDYARQFLGGD